MANVSKLLFSTVEDVSFIANLEADKTLLLAARQKIRDELRRAFATASREQFGTVVVPRFFTQGSCAYGTLNGPAWPPKQQKDLDDGCYLPLSFVRGARPSVAAKIFFDFVDGVLEKLAKREGWHHIKKPTCVRLVIGPDAHVDVPLYAIPDAEFIALNKAMDSRADSHTAKRKLDAWEMLPSDAVLLAHREEDWVESDPRKIQNWVREITEIYGPRFKRDSRYLKAWRDHHGLDGCHLSSILLMACVFQAYEAIRLPFIPDREDDRLLQIVERLPDYLQNPVKNPACKTEDLNRMSDQERSRVIAALDLLANQLREAVNRCEQPRRAVDLMISAFGRRLPDRPDLVSITQAAIAMLKAEPKRTVPAPEVGRSQSG